MPIHKVIRRIGDINPLDYDGGFAYLHFETGKPEIEMYLLDDPENDDTEKDEYTVYTCLVEDPGDWADWNAVARSYGTKAEDYVNAFLRNDQDQMICAIEDAAGYYGWFEFDQYPLKLTRAEAEERISRLFGRKYA